MNIIQLHRATVIETTPEDQSVAAHVASSCYAGCQGNCNQGRTPCDCGHLQRLWEAEEQMTPLTLRDWIYVCSVMLACLAVWYQVLA